MTAADSRAVTTPPGSLGAARDRRLLAALRAHRKLLPEAYGAAGLSHREEDAMQAALDAVAEHDDALLAAALSASTLFTTFTNETDESRIPSYDALHAATLRLSDAIRGVKS